jgi:hypothetical protein
MRKYNAHEIRDLYARGEKVVAWLRSREGAAANSQTTILYSYDAQAGSYVALLAGPAHAELKSRIGRHLAVVLDELQPESLLDAGVGEATTLVPVLTAIAKAPRDVFAFEFPWPTRVWM